MTTKSSKRDTTTVANATDRILLNVGGKKYHTTKATLNASGSRFFQALLDTGNELGKAANPNEDDGKDHTTTGKNDQPTELFIDRDSAVFEDVLYFMRTNKIRLQTRLSLTALDDLKTEADFYAYDALLTKCNECLKNVKESIQNSLEPYTSTETSQSYQGIVTKYDPLVIKLADNRQVVYISTATLAGKCRVWRYTDYDEGKIPGCYIGTCDEEDKGDFQLLANFYDSLNGESENDPVCIAHVGLDHVHTGDKAPINYDFRQELKLCLKPNEEEDCVELSAEGSGEWHVLYWKGEPEDIPGLAKQYCSKRRRLEDMAEGVRDTFTLALLDKLSKP